MYNKKQIRVRSTAKPKKDAFAQDKIYANDGLFNPFVQDEVRVPSNVITTHGMPGNVLGTGSDGRQVMMRPNQMYNFGPNVNYVDEEAQFSIGGGVQYMDVALDDDQIKAYKNGGYYVQDLPHAQEGVQTQGTTVPAEPVLTYGEYYAQTADASKKAYDEYITAIEKEKQRVANVRGNVIPTAKKLDAADNSMLTSEWYNSPEGQAYINFTEAQNPKQLEAARQALSLEVKNLLPNQGRYNVARWDANNGAWNSEADPSRELYCTPYGCFTYQKAGATDVPIVGGNLDFVQRVNSGALPFEKISPNQRQPGDMALWVENSPADYTDPSKGEMRRPHHTTVYASPDANDPNNPEAGNYYNANNGVRLAYGLTNYETNREPADRMDYYRYIGQTKKMEAELKNKLAAWEAAENKADRGPKPTLATLPLDMSYFNTERPQEEITKIDYNQQAIDRISQMDISDKKKRKLLKEANDNIIMGQKLQQLKYPTTQPPSQLVNEPMASTQNGQVLQLTDDQIQGFKDGGFVVEDLPTAQNGVYYTHEARPEAKYQRDASGKWSIMLPSTKGEYVPLNDPEGKRTAQLNKGAVMVDPNNPSAGTTFSNYVAQEKVNPAGKTSAQLKQLANNNAVYADKNATAYNQMAEVQAGNEEREAAQMKKEFDAGVKVDPTYADRPKPQFTGPSANLPKYYKQESPYVLNGVNPDGRGNLITQEEKQRMDYENQAAAAQRQLRYDIRELEQVAGKKISDEEFYGKDGKTNYDLLGKYYNPRVLGKIEDQKYKNFIAQNEKDWNNANFADKAFDVTQSFFSNPIITAGNWVEGSGPLYNQAAYLRGDKAGLDPNYQKWARRGTNADDYWIEDYLNVLNPFNHASNAGSNLAGGNYLNAALDIASIIPITGAFKNGPALLNAGKNTLVGRTSQKIGHGLHDFLEAPVLRSAFKPGTVGNPLLQAGESTVGKTLLDMSLGKTLGAYSTAAFPGAAYNYFQDPTAANFTEAALLGFGSPQVMQGVNAVKANVPYIAQYPKTMYNMATGQAPLSFGSFAKNDLVSFADDATLAKYTDDYNAWEGTGFNANAPEKLSATRGRFASNAKNSDLDLYGNNMIRYPQTRGSAASYNVGLQRSLINSKLEAGIPLTAYEKSIALAGERSIMSSTEFEKGLLRGEFDNLNLSDKMLKDVRTVLKHPNDYSKLDIWKSNPELQKIMKDKAFINMNEHIMPAYPNPSQYVNYQSAAEGMKQISNLDNSLVAVKNAMNRAAAERAVGTLERKATKLIDTENEKDDLTYEQRLQMIQNMLSGKKFQDGGISGMPITYVDQPNVYSSGNTRSFTPASAQALNMLNNQIAYEGHLTDDKIAELKRNGFVIEDIDLHLPKNQNQHKPFQLHPYGFVAGNNDGPVNNVIFGGGLNAQFDTPLKQLAAGINIGATNVLGFDNDRVLYNQFGFNRPTFNLNYNIPYKKR